MCIFKKHIVEPETILPVSTKRISITELYSIIQSKFNGARIYLSDNEYLLCNPNDIALFLAQDETNKMGFVTEERDCDDFSYRLLGQFSIPDWSQLCFGIVWTDKHALNCFIDEDKNIWFVEPQTDSIRAGLETWQGSLVGLIVI